MKTFKKYQNDESTLKKFTDFEFLFHIYDFNIEKTFVKDGSPSSKTKKRKLLLFFIFLIFLIFHFSHFSYFSRFSRFSYFSQFSHFSYFSQFSHIVPESEVFLEIFIKKQVERFEDNSYEGLHLDTIFLYSLFSTSYMSLRLRKNLLQILVDYFNQRTFLLSELIETEIIDTVEELAIYKELDGISQIFDMTISVKRLNFLIEKLFHYNEVLEYLTKSGSNQQKVVNSLSQKHQKTREIITMVEILNYKFKERKANPYLYLKTQNILRNLQYHQYFFRILDKLRISEPEDSELIEKILQFFDYFSFLNVINQQQILSNSLIFFNLMNFRFSINKLFASVLECTKSSAKVFDYINTLFDTIENLAHYSPENHTFVVSQVLSILQSLITNQEKVFLPRIQKKILARLLKNKRLLEFTQEKSYLDYRKSLMSDQVKSRESLELHLNVIHLFGNLCRDFKMGTLQMQKVLVYEQMKNLLFDANTPFLFKKAYLKALFQIYIAQINEVNQNLAPNDLAEIFNQLVLPDLSIYTKYLEGIVKLDQGVSMKNDGENSRKNGENSRKNGDFAKNSENFRRNSDTSLKDLLAKNKEIRDKIVENRNYYQSSLDILTEEKPVHTGILNKKQTTTGQNSGMVFDSKKILDDPHEYWQYLFGGKTWDNSRDGLLYFLLDCYYEAVRRKWVELFANDSLSDALSLIKSCLVRMKGTLQKIEKDFNLDLSNYYLMITEAISKIVTKSVTKAGKALKIQNDSKGNYKMEKINIKEDQEQKIVEDDNLNGNLKDVGDDLLDKIRTFLIVRRMKIDDFLNLFNIKLEIVQKGTFIESFLKIFGENSVKTKDFKGDIENLIEKWSIAKNGPNFLNFRKFAEKMRKVFIKKKFNYEEEELKRGDKKEINLEETENSFKKDGQLMSFIMTYYNESLNGNRNNEIKDLAIKFKRNLEGAFDGEKDEDVKLRGYVEAIRKLIMVLSSDISAVFSIFLEFIRNL